MLVSLSWLKKYVELPADTSTLVEDLTMTGLNVERRIDHGYSNPLVVVGKVMEVSQHPNADKLRLCRVQVEPNSTRDIVCGAPNVAEGQYVLVALPGAKLPDGLKIRSAKIRGTLSEGMICSERELGLGEDASGIMVLDGDFEIGTPIDKVLAPPDEVLEIEITPNRPDLLCHIGVAREVAAIYQVPLTGQSEPVTQNKGGGRVDFKVDIAEPADCARYVGFRVSGVRVGPSPPWLANALESVGLNSVNNVVDVANYVMMETGQPIHAFDYKRLKGSQIIVRRAEADEKLLALDENTYELGNDILVIADSKEPVAIAGVIGGEESAVHSDTVEILIESANFLPTLVRSGRKKLNISTDASYRFERGVDRELCQRGAERTAELICQVAGGVIGPLVDNYPEPHVPKRLSIRPAATARLLGTNLSAGEIGGLLGRLGFEIGETGKDAVAVTAPSFRPDIVEEVDLIEEVARLHGYQRIGKRWAYRTTTYATHRPFDAFVESISGLLSARGFNEVIGSSFTDGKELTDFEWGAEDPRSHPIAIRNPLNANHRYLRTSLLPGMLDIIRRNMDHGVKRIHMYQSGKVFLSPSGSKQLPKEKQMLTISVSRPAGTYFWNNSKQHAELFDIKEIIEVIVKALHIDLERDIDYNFDGSSGCFSYSHRDKAVVEGGVLPEPISERYDFEQPVWFATLDLHALYRRSTGKTKFRKLPEYPISKRDLSLVAKPGIHFAEIEKSLVKSAGPLLESLQVFDVYRGDNIADDHTAYGVRLSFRSPKRTLTDADVEPIIDKILTNLKKQFGVELRS